MCKARLVRRKKSRHLIKVLSPCQVTRQTVPMPPTDLVLMMGPVGHLGYGIGFQVVPCTMVPRSGRDRYRLNSDLCSLHLGAHT